MFVINYIFYNNICKKWNGDFMKIKFRVDELMSILIKSENDLIKKYGLDSKKLEEIQDSLKRGNWQLHFLSFSK